MSNTYTDKIQKYSWLFLLIILAIAAILRILFLGSIPNGFYCDEASNAYDSYSILHSLRDQHGQFLPWFTRSIDDYRESLFIFFSIPFIKIFGLNEFAARLPAAFIGILTVLVLYYLVKECFEQKTALVAAFLLAINPWHIHFSRIAFRAILIPLLFCLALLFFVKIRKCGLLHVFIPFYTKYPPQQYQKSVISPETRRELFHGRTDYRIDKYKIASLEKSENINSNCLYIISPQELKTIKAQGYDWKEIHNIKDKRGIEHLKLIELIETQT